MKKNLTALLLTLCMAVFFACPAFAEPDSAPADITDTSIVMETETGAENETDAAENAVFVLDSQQVLTQEQAAALNAKCLALTKQYQCAIYVVTTDTLVNADAYDDAKALYQDGDFGYGDDRSGILILNVVGDRQYAVIAYGRGNEILTDYGREALIADYLVPQLKAGDYNAAFDSSVDRIGEYMADHAAGTPYDVSGGDSEESNTVNGIIIIGIPLLIALIACLIMKAQMKTAVEATQADDYLLRDQFHVTKSEDHFLYQTVTVVHHEHDDKSGGGTTTDKDGFSGSSGSY